MNRWAGLVAATIVTVGGCLLVDPLNDVSLGTGGGGAIGGMGPSGSVTVGPGGTGGAGGGGAGGMAACEGMCSAFDPSLLPSSVRVTDMAFTDDGLLIVGTFSGSVSFPDAGQLDAGTGGDGFVIQYNADLSLFAQAVLPQAGSASALFADVDANGNAVVGGDGDCNGSQGLFINRMVANGLVFEPMNPAYPACVPTIGTVVAEDIAFLDFGGGYISLVGSVDGSIDNGSDTSGTKGFLYEAPPEGGNPTPIFLLGGTGDSAFRSVFAASGSPLWILAGDFAGELQATVPPLNPVTRTAAGQRDLFVMSMDREMTAPNLTVTPLGAPGGNHQAIAIEPDRNDANTAWLAATLAGDVEVPALPLLSGTAGRSAVVLELTPPDTMDSPPTFAGATILSAETSLELVDFAAGAGKFHLGGQSQGAITVSSATMDLGTAVSGNCHPEAFLMTVAPSSPSIEGQRCGNGSQSVMAIGRYRDSGNELAAVLAVPQNSRIDFGQGSMLSAQDTTYLVLGE